MGRSGFFLIQVDEPGDLPAPQGLEATVVRGADRGLPTQSPDLRLEWIDGEPHVTVLEGGRGAQRNGATIPPGVPVALRPGDTITLGSVRFLWQEPADQVAQGLEQSPGEAIPVVQPEMTYRVLIRSPRGSQETSLTESELAVGRAPDNDIVIPDEHVSAHHAKLVRRAHGYEIIDLDSVNGLRYKNKLIVRRMLVDGDEVWLSRGVSLTYRVDQPAPASPEATQAAVLPPHLQPVDSEKTVLSRGPTDPTPTSEPSEAGEPAWGRAAPSPADDADQTVLRPSRAATGEPGFGDQVVDRPSRDASDEATVIASQGALDEPRPAREGTTGEEKPGAPPEGLAADETILAPERLDPASRPADATVMRPAETPPEAPDRMQAIRPEPEATEGPSADVPQETAAVDMAEYIGDTSIAAVSGTIIRDTRIPHLVVHLPTRTWEVQFSDGDMTVGRDINSDIHIPDDSVSRHHATIERRGDDFVIRDAQSRNGIWVNQQRIERRMLRDGDVVSVGRAKLMFKGGFSADDLTLVGRPRTHGQPTRRPVVFVPGFGGSELWLGSERLWPNPKVIVSNPEVYSLPGDPRIEARQIVSDVVIVPNIIKQQQYSRLGDYLETGLGYKRGRDLLEFAYDWRQDIRLASQRLAEAIDRWGVQPPVTIISHSLGTLVTRYYVERLGGKKVVERIVLLGGPHYGVPKGLSLILVGPGLLPFGMGDERMRRVVASFPSAYQILPVYPCVTDQDDNYIEPLYDESWLPEHQRPFLRAGRSFRNELGLLSSVPSVSIFGYGLKTIIRVKIHRGVDGQWEKVEYLEDTAGDLSVPSGSAVLKQSEIHPVLQEHGSLYVDDDVKMRLKVELTRSTTWKKGV